MAQLELITKTFGTELVRLTQNDGEALFVAKDVCEALGYKRARDAVSQHCKGAVKHRVLTSGGEQDVTFVPESDVYRLTMGSKLPHAEKFKDWVCEEVLPEIRENGSYEVKEKPATQMQTTGDPILDMLQAMTHQRKEMLEMKEQHDRMVEELNTIKQGNIEPGWNTIGELARMSGLSKNKAQTMITIYNVPTKRIPMSGEQRITHVMVGKEKEFFEAYETVKLESETKPGSDFLRHPRLGRFTLREMTVKNS